MGGKTLGLFYSLLFGVDFSLVFCQIFGVVLFMFFFSVEKKRTKKFLAAPIAPRDLPRPARVWESLEVPLGPLTGSGVGQRGR